MVPGVGTGCHYERRNTDNNEQHFITMLESRFGGTDGGSRKPVSQRMRLIRIG